MAKLHIVVGNKNYSSWSLRAWAALEHFGLDFEETVITLGRPDTRRRITAHSGAGRVPVLHHGKTTVWESLAILEYLDEAFPDKGFWPRSKAARALARSIANEMHAGFGALRSACPMNLHRPRGAPATPLGDKVKADIARIENMWRDCRKAFGKGGPFLFGRFSNADAMYLPVATRFDTYAIPVAKATRDYMDAVLGTPAFRAWKEAGLKEKWLLPEDEVI